MNTEMWNGNELKLNNKDSIPWLLRWTLLFWWAKDLGASFGQLTFHLTSCCLIFFKTSCWFSHRTLSICDETFLSALHFVMFPWPPLQRPLSRPSIPSALTSERPRHRFFCFSNKFSDLKDVFFLLAGSGYGTCPAQFVLQSTAPTRNGPKKQKHLLSLARPRKTNQ